MVSLPEIKHIDKRSISDVKKRLQLHLLKRLIKKLTYKLPRFVRARLWQPISAVAILLLAVLFFTPIFSGTLTKSVPILYSSQTMQDPSIELGTTITKQAGVSGTEKITYSEPKSLFNMLFGGGETSKLIEETSTITKQPVKQIISFGTLKYQYMYCSNGLYRYYTNAQFKNPQIGFTHKSPDYCAKNNQGTETQLASVPPKSSGLSTTSYAPTIPTNFSVPDCTTMSIPYGVDYENASWLPEGQTQTYAGLDGTYFSCLGTTVQPVDEVIYSGTGQDYNEEAQQEATDLARQKCTDEYNSAMAQIDAAGAGDSSAVIELQQLYSQCLDAAG